MWTVFLLMACPLFLGAVIDWCLACVGQTDQFSNGFRAGVRVGRSAGMLRPVAGIEKKEGGAA